MSDINISQSLDISNSFSFTSNQSSVRNFESSPTFISHTNTHSYHFSVDNPSDSSSQIEAQVLVSNSKDSNHWTVIYQASIDKGVKQSFNFCEVFNFEYSKVIFKAAEGSFSVHESHNPLYKPRSESGTIPTPAPLPTPTPVPTPTPTVNTPTPTPTILTCCENLDFTVLTNNTHADGDSVTVNGVSVSGFNPGGQFCFNALNEAGLQLQTFILTDKDRSFTGFVTTSRPILDSTVYYYDSSGNCFKGGLTVYSHIGENIMSKNS